MNSNVSVYCRIRPRSTKADLSYGTDALEITNNHQIIQINNNITTTTTSIPISTTTIPSFGPFNQVFGPTTTQDEIFRNVGLPCITNVLDGYNSTIFVYGQTGSGKTYTMEGDLYHYNHESGLIPRLIHSLFHTMNHIEETMEFTVRCTYIEVYMERVYDLLYNTISPNTRTNKNRSTTALRRIPSSSILNNQPSSLLIRQDNQRGIYVEGAIEKYVSSSAELMTLLRKGYQNRCNGMTGMNDQSSRSHTLVLLTIDAKDKQTGGIRTSKLSLVDLAGSEQVSRTGAEGNTLEEAKIINRSLFTLSKCISALALQAENTNINNNDNHGIPDTNPSAAASVHIPYRDSKLTRLLQDSLGGNARTTLIICLSPCSSNLTETISTLRFGSQAKKMKNIAIINRRRTVEEMERLIEKAQVSMDAQTQLINALQKRIQILENPDNDNKTNILVTDEVPQTILLQNEPMAGQVDDDDEANDAWGDADAWAMVSPLKSPKLHFRRNQVPAQLSIDDDTNILITPPRTMPMNANTHGGSMLSPLSMHGILKELTIAKETAAHAVAVSAMDAEELTNLREENRLLQQEIDTKDKLITELIEKQTDELKTLSISTVQDILLNLQHYTCSYCQSKPYQTLECIDNITLIHEQQCYNQVKAQQTIKQLQDQLMIIEQNDTNKNIENIGNTNIEAKDTTDLRTNYLRVETENTNLHMEIQLQNKRIQELQNQLQTNEKKFHIQMKNYQEVLQKEKELLIQEYENNLQKLTNTIGQVSSSSDTSIDMQNNNDDDDDDNYTVCDEFMEIENIIGRILENRKYNNKYNPIPTTMNKEDIDTISKQLINSKPSDIDTENIPIHSSIVKPVERGIRMFNKPYPNNNNQIISNHTLVTRTIQSHRGPIVTVLNNSIKQENNKII